MSKLIKAPESRPDYVGPAGEEHAGFLENGRLELRRIADQEPHLAVELRQVAQKLEAEAEDLARRNTE